MKKPLAEAASYIATKGVTPIPEPKKSCGSVVFSNTNPPTGAAKLIISPSLISSCKIVETSPSCSVVTSRLTPKVKSFFHLIR